MKRRSARNKCSRLESKVFLSVFVVFMFTGFFFSEESFAQITHDLTVIAQTNGSPGAPAGATFDILQGGSIILSNVAYGSTRTLPEATYTLRADMVTGYQTPAEQTFFLGRSGTRLVNYISLNLTVTHQAGLNGSLLGTAIQTVTYGDNTTEVEAIPNSGFVFVNWTGDVGPNDPYNPVISFSNVQNDITVTAFFATNRYTVTAAFWDNVTLAEVPGGTFLPSNSQIVAEGGTAVFSFTAPDFYRANGTSAYTGTAVSTVLALLPDGRSGNATANVVGSDGTLRIYVDPVYMVTHNAGPGGILSGIAAQAVVRGGSSSIVTALPNPGYHFVNWTGDVGSNDPSNPSISFTNVQSAITVTANFARDTGTLEVITEVAGGGALPVGAGWSLATQPGDYSGTGSWIYNSSEASPQAFTNSVAESGDFSVNANSVVDYSVVVSPAGLQSLANGGGISFTVSYTRELGELNVNIVDNGSGGSFSISGPGDFNGGLPLTGQTADFSAMVPTGNYTVTFDEVADYDLGINTTSFAVTLPSAGGNLSTSAVETVTGTYAPLFGSLQLFLEPNSELNDMGGWRVIGASGWRPTGDLQERMPPGFYKIEFLDIPGWITPDNIECQVIAGQVTMATVFYTKESGEQGSLQIFIEDNFGGSANEAGAMWRPVFGNSSASPPALEWHASGEVVHGLPLGDMGIEFTMVPGYVPPVPTSVDIKPGLNKATGEYVRPLIVHAADYNGDGADDLAVFYGNSGLWSVASIEKPGASSPAVMILEQKFGQAGDIPVPGDYDGDGIADLAYYRESTGDWSISRQSSLKNIGVEHDIPVPGDYNGDGRTDPAFFRPSTGEWLIYDVYLEKIIKFTFGGPGDVPVPGNYDGDKDGTTEPAVYNTVSGRWRVAFYDETKGQWIERKKLRIRGGSNKRLRVKFGGIGDIPVQADYDGDGSTDIAIYRRDGGIWMVKDQFQVELGLEGDMPVPNDWTGLGHAIPAVFRAGKGIWLASDNQFKARHGKGGRPLMSGR